MLNDTDKVELDKFLATRGEDILPCVQEHEGVFAIGMMLGKWRIEAFLGHGGSGEVYRVVHSVTQIEAAAKVLTQDDVAARMRFQGEIEFLSQNQLRQFPRYFESGECEEHSYFILELLEPIDVPTDEKGIAAYLTEVCSCVRALHLAGIVHRDLKPKNIMRRTNGEIVLIDFGLAKDTFASPRPRTDISIVSEKVFGVGTPGYAAPEQLTGGEISPATDIHALGQIANAAFDGNPPRSWESIIRRATSSIPSQRYKTIDDFAAAIRKRNRLRNFIRAGLSAASVALAIGIYFGRENIPIVRDIVSEIGFNSLCEAVTTNVVSRQLVRETIETNSLGMVYVNERVYRIGTNTIDITLIRLNQATNVFARPMKLKSDREYWVVGPGILDASVVSDGENTTIRLKDCIFVNRSSVPMQNAGIRYVFQGGAMLDFVNMDRPHDFTPLQIEGFDGAFDEIHFRGEPSERFKGLGVNQESVSNFTNISIKLETSALCHICTLSAIANNFYFPRHILPVKSEYIVESMNKTGIETERKGDDFDYRLDPNRIRTEAEVATFADVFSISYEAAHEILTKARLRCAV